MSDDEQSFLRKRKAEEELFEDGDETKENFEDEDEMVDEDGNVVGDLDFGHAGTQAWLVKVGDVLKPLTFLLATRGWMALLIAMFSPCRSQSSWLIDGQQSTRRGLIWAKSGYLASKCAFLD